MPDFRLHDIPIPTGPYEIVELEINGRRPLSDFLDQQKKAGNRREIIRFQTYLGELAQGSDLPPKTLKRLRGQSDSDGWDEYEIRVGRLRFYLFYEPPSRRIVVLGELKKTVKKKDNKEQRRNIEHLREIKARYRAQQQTKPPRT